MLPRPDAVRIAGMFLYLLVGAVAIAVSEGERRARRNLESEIADKKHDESALRESEDHYRHAIELNPQVPWTADADGQITDFSRRWLEMTGLTREQALGVGWRRVPHPDDRPRMVQAWSDSVETGLPYDIEHRIRLGTGEFRWMRSRAFARKDSQGRVVRWYGSTEDIQNRRMAEERLRECNAALRAFYENSPICMGIVELTDDGDLLHVYENSATCRFFGVEPGTTSGRLASALSPDRHAVSLWLARFRESKSAGAPVQFEYEHRTSATWRWLSVTVKPIGPGPSSRMRFCYLAEDISQRKQLSEQLVSERNLQDALFAATPIGLGLVDADFRILRINKAVATTNSVPFEAHIGHTVAEVLPGLWPILEPLYRKVVKTGEPVRNFELEGETPDRPGFRRSWLANYYPVRLSGAVVGVGFAIIETTEARLREARLRELDRRFRDRAKILETVLAATPAPIFISHDRKCRLITGNPAAFKLLKTPEGGVVSATAPGELPKTRTFREYRDGRPIEPQDLPMQVAARDGVEVHGAELSFVFNDGDVRHAYGSTVPLRDGIGNVVGSIAAFVDITRLKTAEEALREADRRKDEFLAMLAHELRNPLAPILNAVTIMTMTENDRETQQWAYEVIDRQVRHLSNLVDDLLDVSRITQGKVALTKAPLMVSSFINAAVESSRPLIDVRRHKLDVMVYGEPARVCGDLTRLSQVVLNLLNNAAKFTPEGGRIELIVESDKNLCRIRVRDNGEGIAPETLPRVLDLFAQGSRSLDRSQGGLGVGLTLVKRLVKMHGGTVVAHSDGPGKGSQFLVQMPLLVEEPSVPAQMLPQRTRSRDFDRAFQILVVDDSQDTRNSLARLLSGFGHEVEVAHDGISAIAAAVSFRPNLVLLDIGLPGMDGYEVARRLRKEPAVEGAEPVALTGYGSELDRMRSSESGFDRHLLKPVDLDALLDVLAHGVA